MKNIRFIKIVIENVLKNVSEKTSFPKLSLLVLSKKAGGGGTKMRV
jgi:hypothetical protein